MAPYLRGLRYSPRYERNLRSSRQLGSLEQYFDADVSVHSAGPIFIRPMDLRSYRTCEDGTSSISRNMRIKLLFKAA